ncbi:unnamed protein product [Paramecium primaurelia]|uniref:Transmembrane protein n=1 Tax=Paramecium primaurelia TaxID=5886 RepID=A0A8S1QTH7_PARPR|nr:unnamed protein product [Paramecium primaurelia]
MVISCLVTSVLQHSFKFLSLLTLILCSTTQTGNWNKFFFYQHVQYFIIYNQLLFRSIFQFIYILCHNCCNLLFFKHYFFVFKIINKALDKKLISFESCQIIILLFIQNKLLIGSIQKFIFLLAY